MRRVTAAIIEQGAKNYFFADRRPAHKSTLYHIDAINKLFQNVKYKVRATVTLPNNFVIDSTNEDDNGGIDTNLLDSHENVQLEKENVGVAPPPPQSQSSPVLDDRTRKDLAVLLERIESNAPKPKTSCSNKRHLMKMNHWQR